MGDLSLTLWRAGEVRVGHAERAVTLPARGALELNAGELFDEFRDLSYAYRFGPASHDVVAATLRTPDGLELARAFHFVGGWPSTQELDVGLTAELRRVGADGLELRVGSRRFAQAVHVDVEHFDCSDNYFHLQPGESRTILFLPRPGQPTGGASSKVTLSALNARALTSAACP